MRAFLRPASVVLFLLLLGVVGLTIFLYRRSLAPPTPAPEGPPATALLLGREPGSRLLVLALDMSGTMKRTDPRFLEARAVRTLLETARLLGPDQPAGLRIKVAVVLFGSAVQVLHPGGAAGRFFVLDWRTSDGEVEGFANRLAPGLGGAGAADQRQDWFTDFNGPIEAVAALLREDSLAAAREGVTRGTPLIALVTDGGFEPCPLRAEYWEDRQAGAALLGRVASLGRVNAKARDALRAIGSPQTFDAPVRLDERSLVAEAGARTRCKAALDEAAPQVRDAALALLLDRLDGLRRARYASGAGAVPWMWRVIGLRDPGLAPDEAARFEAFLRDTLGPAGAPPGEPDPGRSVILATGPATLEPQLLGCLADWLGLPRYRLSREDATFHLDPTIEGAALFARFQADPAWEAAGPRARVVDDAGAGTAPRPTWTGESGAEQTLVWHLRRPRGAQWRLDPRGERLARDPGDPPTLIARSRLTVRLQGLPALWQVGDPPVHAAVVFNDLASGAVVNLGQRFASYPESLVGRAESASGRIVRAVFRAVPAGRPTRYVAELDEIEDPGTCRLRVCVRGLRFADSGTEMMERELEGAYEVSWGMVPRPAGTARLGNRPRGAGGPAGAPAGR